MAVTEDVVGLVVIGMVLVMGTFTVAVVVVVAVVGLFLGTTGGEAAAAAGVVASIGTGVGERRRGFGSTGISFVAKPSFRWSVGSD